MTRSAIMMPAPTMDRKLSVDLAERLAGSVVLEERQTAPFSRLHVLRFRLCLPPVATHAELALSGFVAICTEFAAVANSTVLPLRNFTARERVRDLIGQWDLKPYPLLPQDLLTALIGQLQRHR